MAVIANSGWSLSEQSAAGHAPAALSIAEWAELASEALEPTIANDPAWLMPAFRELAPHHPAQLVTLGSAFKLAGIAALRESRWRWGFPIQAMVSWDHPHHFLGTPLMSRNGAVAGFKELILRGRVLVLTQVTLDGEAMEALRMAAADTGAHFRVTARWERAGYKPGDFDAHLIHHLPRKRRKELRRLRKRLEETGDLQLRRLARGDDLEDWFGRFEALEVAGWKGRRGTALAQEPSDSRLLREVGRLLHHDGRLLFWELALEGRPVAMLFAMISGTRAWLGKIAYDENFASFSPGVLLLVDASRDFDGRKDIDFVDSCAVPDHPMINRLWHDRLAVGSVMVIPPNLPAWQAHALPVLEAARNNAITFLKSIRPLLTRRRK